MGAQESRRDGVLPAKDRGAQELHSQPPDSSSRPAHRLPQAPRRAGSLGVRPHCRHAVSALVTTTVPEVWLRGPIDGIQPLLQPAAHTIVQVGEDVLPIVQDLTPAQLWARPGNAASIGFHLAHLPGSLDRLLTYSRGESLTPQQFERLTAERTVHEDRPELRVLLKGFTDGIG